MNANAHWTALPVEQSSPAESAAPDVAAQHRGAATSFAYVEGGEQSLSSLEWSCGSERDSEKAEGFVGVGGVSRRPRNTRIVSPVLETLSRIDSLVKTAYSGARK